MRKKNLQTTLKFGYSEKATKFERICTNFFELTKKHQMKLGDFFQIFVAFTEYLNFIKVRVNDQNDQFEEVSNKNAGA